MYRGEKVGNGYLKKSSAISSAIYHIYKNYELNNQYLYNKKSMLIINYNIENIEISLVRVILNQKYNIIPEIIYSEEISDFGVDYIDLLLTQFLLGVAIQEQEENLNLNEAFNTINDFILEYRNSDVHQLIYDNKKSDYIIKKYMKESKKIRENLCNNDSVEIDIEYIKEKIITRDIFDEYIMKNQMILKTIYEHLNSFNINKQKEIDEVILTGDGSCIRCISDIVENIFSNSRIFKGNKYIHAVQYGNDILDKIKNGEKIEPFSSTIFTGMLEKGIYMRCNGNEIKLFESGTPYPLKKVEKYSVKNTFALIESIKFEFYKKTNNSKEIITNMNLYHPCFYTGDDIDIYMNIDENGLFKVQIIHRETKETIQFTEINK